MEVTLFKQSHRSTSHLLYESTAIRRPATAVKVPERWDATSPCSNTSELIGSTEIPASPFTGFHDTKQAGAYESIYAIPKTLLVFLAKTTELINEVADAREKSGDTQIPAALAEKCDALETSIMDWRGTAASRRHI